MYYDPLRLAGDAPKKKRATISKSEWEALKKAVGNKCVLCGKTERAVGELQKAHIKAESKGGSQVLPMCPTCHKNFDKGLATDTQLKKLGLTRAQYFRMIPKPGSREKAEGTQEGGIPKIKYPQIKYPKW